jgi:NAD(P)-dependent dehydrogenase (short-subunit alcohol dehydrogenase family)
VTGGASGLGEAAARQLADRGAKVVIVDLNDDKGLKVAGDIGGAYVRADVTDTDAVIAAITAAEELGTFRTAVAAAGIGAASRTIGRDGSYDSAFNLDYFKQVIDVNLIGVFNTVRLTATAISRTQAFDGDGQKGAIVTLASIAAFDGQIGQAAYSASKGGIVGMTLPIARDLADAHIRCVTIAPGIFDTALLGTVPEEVRQALGASVPHPARLGDPAEYAALVAHIVENRMLNGEVIRLDGALRMAPR